MPSAIAQNAVLATPAADPADALEHFAALLRYETDCWDVRDALSLTEPGFVLWDVRSPELFAAGHLPGAVSFPHRRITARTVADLGAETLVVVYCAGPHCNGADKAALALARLGRPVKKMIGGITGWRDEGFEVVTAPAS